MKIYLATQTKPDKEQGTTLTKVKGLFRLMSYIYIIEDKELDFKKYVVTGKV